jgi:hypothetical protein
MAGSPNPFEGSLLGRPNGPVPILATLHAVNFHLTIQFDRDLESPIPAGITAGARRLDLRATYTAWLLTAPDTIEATVADSVVPDVGDDMAFLTVPPTGVRSLSGVPAAAFTDFPLTIV